jgi:RimJ/RimL family protein N-acetyltransferase
MAAGDATPRVTLVGLKDEDFEWLMRAEGDARRGLRSPPGGVDELEVLEHVRAITQRLEAQRYRASWMIVAEGEVVGLIGHKHPPSADGRVEIGYGVAASRRRRGYATAAVAEVVREARLDPSIDAVVAETTRSNVASQRTLQRNGFVRVGERLDEHDGEVIVWRVAVKPRRSDEPLAP